MASSPPSPSHTPLAHQAEPLLSDSDENPFVDGAGGMPTPFAHDHHHELAAPPAIAPSIASTPHGSTFGEMGMRGDSTFGFMGQSEKVPLAGGSRHGTSKLHKSEPGGSATSRRRRRRPWLWLLILGILVIIIVAIILPIYFLVIRPKHKSSQSAAAGSGGVGTGNGNPFSPSGATSGENGSVIIMDNGTEFTYINNFGGYWIYDPSDPFNNNARPNSWTPPLNQSWDFSTNRIFGVNLGGLFVLEPFITPSFFQKYTPAGDEWDVSVAMANDTASGGLQAQMENHYNTFITEEDIAQIAGAGLNWIRLPIAYWAIETWAGEAFLEKVQWKYIVRVLGWARKYGLRVCLDLHTAPGSQNGYNHSGRLSPVNFLSGVMGLANAERTLYYIRVITEFISQPEWKDVVPIFGIINEPLVGVIGMDVITSFYLEAHDMIRSITGYGEGNGPYIAIHDGFFSLTVWNDFLPGSDRIILDTHPYFAFGGVDLSPLPVPGPDGLPGGKWPLQACNAWGPSFNTSQNQFGVTIAGEFSAGFNDCGLFLQGVTGSDSNNPTCAEVYDDWTTYNDTVKEGLKNYVSASMDALSNFFFWTWKIGEDQSGVIGSPLWSYKLGLEQGWIPSDPRTAIGKCASLNAGNVTFNGTYAPYQTGADTTEQIVPTATASFGVWPPATISGLAGIDLGPGGAADLPRFTATGSVVTLAEPTFTQTLDNGVSTGDGWANTLDTSAAVTAVATCSYPDAWFPIVTGAVQPGC